MPAGERGLRIMQFMSAVAFLGVLCSGGFFAYWRWFDPILPDVVVLHAEIRELDLSSRGLQHARIFEVLRTLHSPEPVEAQLHAYFEKPVPGQEVIEIDGRVVLRDRTQYAVPPIAFHMDAGTHQRDRLWEVPSGLEPGEYIYRAVLRGCNPVRCRDIAFPALKAVIN